MIVGSGELEFDEFLTLAARFLVEEDTEAMQEELREAFRLYDKEGNGYINVSDLREILRALEDNMSEDELDEMIAEIDTDGSGTVDFDGKFVLDHLKGWLRITGETLVSPASSSYSVLSEMPQWPITIIGLHMKR